LKAAADGLQGKVAGSFLSRVRLWDKSGDQIFLVFVRWGIKPERVLLWY
jgi:hypothetical protein